MNPSEQDEYGHPITFAAYSSKGSFSSSLADLYGGSAGILVDTNASTSDSAPSSRATSTKEPHTNDQDDKSRTKLDTKGRNHRF
ncbi:uncharacterized protein SPPG_09184 [Spizellomyces punctatus DAOM BR117]|uniref:Uncharacterized protein n=1 Tax=Spizellomyces punctatus (strain DAOM BR117) TaxID=645134 RepID=A0A0L0HEV2_SPIPD|nr:uncharacterized protein SPPG_09184 [Spizellomyces punctatus DAOM BR117]KNC99990.1 hypothetical protein SPPG_09184 [Spizellomyces punctatus DAOM BR117]|eukprot:XP_016608030.1 hypothetical protein SPPG_09184 [Spizellomyces punctatus DAOM BR117]